MKFNPKIPAIIMAWLSMTALADVRPYVWTYDFSQTPYGDWEVETYWTQTISDLDSIKSSAGQSLQIEYEAGMKHFDIGLYQRFSQVSGGSLTYDGYKLRTRVPFADKGKWPVNLMGYLEIIGSPDFSEHALEAKLIATKDFGPCNIAINPTVETEFAGDDIEVESEFSAGTSHAFGTIFRAGIETKINEDAVFAGPTISHGSPGNWLALGALFRITGERAKTDDFQIRLIWGLSPSGK